VNEDRAPDRDLLQDRTREVETPEHVSIEYPLAGLGSRFAALLLDLLVVAALLAAGPLLVLLVAAVSNVSAGLVPGVLAAILMLYSFAVVWGYFFWFEAFRDGQTIGKRWMSIRVVMEGGYPITVEAAAIRNLIRMIDVQGLGAVGGFVMLLHPRAKRLGDLAAGTVVVRELPVDFPEVADLPAAAAAPRLPDPAFAALEKYVDRRDALARETRDAIATELAPRLHALEPPREKESPDAYLVRFHAEERARRLAARLGERAGSAAALSLLRAKRDRWERFRRDAAAVRRRGLASLGEDAVGEFAGRYRELTADLARARTYGASAQTIYALERLVGAGHNLFYRPARQSARRAWAWLAGGFPRLVRRRWKPVVASALLLFAPAILGYALLRLRPEHERRLVPSEMIARADEAPARRDSGAGYIDVPQLGHGFLSSAIISNNVQVSFIAFGMGVTAGILTALVLVVNGLHLGSVLAVFHNRDVLDVIGTFVLPHGVIELTAICIAGGAGLWMGSGLLLPGRLARRAAFAERAREAVSLIAGVVVMLVLAGLIEGFVSPARIDGSVKLAFSAVAAFALVLYLTTAGRKG
jgi:uncharacterized membrane protein SpoIIM required for sporulation/uncharacterized RDD family membrane protein YckC